MAFLGLYDDMSWPIKKLGEIAFVDWGNTSITKASYKPSGYLAVSATGPDGFMDSFEHNCPAIILSAIGAKCGKTFWVDGKWTAIKNTITIFSNEEKTCLTKYLYYFLTPNKWTIVGGGQPFITKGAAEKIKIPLLPLLIQKQIVNRLDKIAEAQKLNDKLIQKTDELFQSLLHKELNPAGRNWEVKKIKDIATVKNGGTPSTKNPKYWNGKILWLTPKELSGFKDIEIFDTERKISDEGLKHSSATLLPADTVLLTSRAPIGYIAIAGASMATNQGFKNFVCDSKLLNNKFLYFFLRLKVKYLQSLGRGATFTEISKTAVEKIDVPLPPLKIQKQIVAKLSAVQDYKKQLLEQKMKLKELFDSVLYKSMHG